jgi:chemotaxis protein MotB
MARKKKHEEHQNHEAWAIPYGDLVTLLFALFTVMYAMSSVNEGKYRVLSDSLIAAFRGAPKSNEPIPINKNSSGKGGDAKLTGVRPTALMKLKDPRANPSARSQPGNLGLAGPQESDSTDARMTAFGSGPSDGRQHGGAESGNTGGGRTADHGVGALGQMANEVRKALQGLIDQNLVKVRQNDLSLEIEIKTDILFPSGVAALSPPAMVVLDKVADILKPFPNAIRVEGHTDNRPISTSIFPSNWELSSARAANVVQRFSKTGVDPLRMQVLGLGEFRPVASNDNLDGRNSNRRVVIVVMGQAPDNGRADPIGPAIQSIVGVTSPSGATVLIQRPQKQGKEAT